MKKKLIIAITFVLLAAFAMPTAFAAITDAQKTEVEGIYQQMHELRKQLIQKYVAAGEITAEEAKLIEDRMDQRFESRKAQGFENFGPGMGRGGRGCGGQGGFGGGCGGGGCGIGGVNDTAPTANPL